jgi:hypothetical protein
MERSEKQSRIFYTTLAVACAWSAIALAGDIVMQIPADNPPTEAEAKSTAAATIEGTLDRDTVRFNNVVADTKYDAAITLKDGIVLQGADLGWYSIEATISGAGDINDDDRQQIADILNGAESFYNKKAVLFLQGNHDRATALVQLIRDKSFHSDTGGEVIWHIELWYFKNQHGGWEKVQQTNKVLRRERFPNQKAFEDAVGHLRWTPELGGLKIPPGQGILTVKLKTQNAER